MCYAVRSLSALKITQGIRTLKIVFFNRVISVISVVVRKTTLTISDSTGEPVSMESEIARVVSLCTTGISG